MLLAGEASALAVRMSLLSSESFQGVVVRTGHKDVPVQIWPECKGAPHHTKSILFCAEVVLLQSQQSFCSNIRVGASFRSLAAAERRVLFASQVRLCPGGIAVHVEVVLELLEKSTVL